MLLIMLSMLTFGSLSSVYVIDRVLTNYGSIAVNLYLTNAVYEGFHPVLAPEISENFTGKIPAMFTNWEEIVEDKKLL